MQKIAKLVNSLKLKPHQQAFIDKYNANGGRQIAYHGLGSGKTITSIGAVESTDSKSALVLTPAALQKNYKDTVQKFVTPDAQSKYHVMSYEKFRMNPQKWVSEKKPDTLVIDEFHRDKDPNSKSYQALQQIRPQVKRVMGLTGTVVQNKPEEIFPLAKLVDGGRNIKVPTAKEFEHKYITKERVYPKGLLAGTFARLTGRYGERKVLKNPSELKRTLGPLVHKNLPDAEFLSNFPKKEIVDIPVAMGKDQQKRYNYFMKKDLGPIDRWRIKHDLPPKARDSNSFFSKLTRMRQVSNDPGVLSEGKLKSDVSSSGKLSVAFKNLKKHLEANPNHKGVVYSNFTRSGLDAYSKALSKANIPHGVFSGDVPRKQRNQDVTDYNEGKKRVLLLSPSGAEGLDLKKTSLLQNLDPHWNPAKMDQIFGRAARYKSHEGLPPEEQKVRIERYTSAKRPGFIGRLFGKKLGKEETVDKYIYRRAHEKEQLTSQLNKIL